MNPKICPICKEEFTPKSSRQKYCKKGLIKVCPVCGDEYIGKCAPDSPVTCTKPECKKKAGYIASINKVKVCKICGQEFTPTSSTQEYCNKPIERICEVCGNTFTIRCTGEEYKRKTCSKECMDKLATTNRQSSYASNHTVKCALCGKEFHPKNNTQKVCDDDHYRECCVCGKQFKLDYKPGRNLIDLRTTCSDECFSQFRRSNNPFKDKQVQEKIKQTMLDKYGVEHPAQSPEIRKKMYATYKDNTGYDHPAHNPATLKGKKLYLSSLEDKLRNTLENNRINYEAQKLVTKDGLSHAFDFYLPDYKMYVDVDGDYYHGYLDDSNGEQVSEDRDNIRTSLINDDETFVVIVESAMKEQIDELLLQLKEIDCGTFNYADYMFNWCRSIEFPYPEYTEKRLLKDYRNLCKYESDIYKPSCNYGISSIRHFHKSIYDAHVGNSPSLKQAWEDDEILKKVIRNRMIYKNNVDPSKILAGFYISKAVPKVSVFNPVLARYLTLKYLSNHSEVLDPFSGFSGRLLGVCSTGKHYLGSDLNPKAVTESNQIIALHQLNAEVFEQDVLSIEDGAITGECLLTCPPYANKETYSVEDTYKTCDGWIDWILSRYTCKRYVFVIDKTEKYVDMIAEELVMKSYFNSINEKVVVIDR